MDSVEDPPRPTRLTVEMRVRKEFPNAEVVDILAVLDQYGTEPRETEVHRVHLALLKLSRGRQDLLANGVKSAKADYRDVLANAEFPRQMALRPLKADGTNAIAIDLAIQQDMIDYRDWLNGT